MVPRPVTSTGGSIDVALPIALTRRNVAGQHEIGQGRQRNVVSASDARFQHAAAPDGNTVSLTEIVDTLGFGKSAHAPELDVDDAAGLKTNCLLGLMRRANTLVETDRRIELRLQGRRDR